MNDFSFYIDGVKTELVKGSAGAPDRRVVSGVISTDDRDAQGERMLQEGLDFSYFLDKGVLKYEHGTKSPANIIGFPLKVMKGGHQTRVVGELFPAGHRMADDTWETIRATEAWNKSHPEAKKGLGWSVEGKYTARDRASGVVKSARIHNVVITPNPVNTQTFVELVKSLQAGSDQSVDMTGGSALRAESLEGAERVAGRRKRKTSKKSIGGNMNEAVAKGLEELGARLGEATNFAFTFAGHLRKSEDGNVDLAAVMAEADALKSAEPEQSGSDSDSDESDESAAPDADASDESDESEKKKPTKKGLAEQVVDLQKSIDETASLTADALTTMRADIVADVTKSVEAKFAPLVERLASVIKLNKSLVKAVNAAGLVEAPAGAPATGAEKLAKGVAPDGDEMIKSLSKSAAGRSQIADAVLALATEGKGGATGADVTQFEMLGTVRKSLVPFVAEKLGDKA